MLLPSHYRLNKRKLLSLLDVLSASSPMFSLYIMSGLPRAEINKTLESQPDWLELPQDLSDSISDSPTGAAVFWGEQHRYLVLPPFPVTEMRRVDSADVEPLRSLLQQELVVALILVRLGAYAIGVFQGEKPVSSKVGTGLVHARHRQGGSSAHRFERHRAKQMEAFFERICVHAREQLEPYRRELDFVIYGGTRDTVLSFRKQCHYLQGFDNRTLGLLLNIREPRRASLEEAISEAWSSRVTQWQESSPGEEKKWG